jgi:hypothetical protein
MPSYAYRAIDDRGSAIAVPVEASDAETVLVEAKERGHHVVMLYRLINSPERKYVRLFQSRNLPLPAVVRHSRFDRFLERVRLRSPSMFCWIGWAPLRDAIRDKRLSGRVGWLALEIETVSLIAAAHWTCRELFDFSPPAPPEPEPAPEVKPRKARIVEADETFTPPASLREFLTVDAAQRDQLVPYQREGRRVLLLAAEPDELQVADDIALFAEEPVELVRCHENAEKNAAIIRRILENIHGSAEPHEKTHLEELGFDQDEDFGVDDPMLRKYEEPPVPWEGSALGLPDLPQEDDNLLASRVGFVTDFSGCILLREDRGSMYQLCQRFMRDAFARDADGLNIGARRNQSVVSSLLLNGSRIEESLFDLDLPLSLLDGLIYLFATAVGIPPTTLPPAKGEIEINSGDARYTITGDLRMTDAGQTIDVVWRKSE